MLEYIAVVDFEDEHDPDRYWPDNTCIFFANNDEEAKKKGPEIMNEVWGTYRKYTKVYRKLD